MTILIQYRDTDGKLRSFDIEADSIEAGEARARLLGYREIEGFELVEVVEFDKRDPWWVRFGKWMLEKYGR